MQEKPGTPVSANDNEPPPRTSKMRQPRMQACLQCGGQFRSQGAFNRICDACKTDEAWQSGEDFSLILPPRRNFAG